MRGVFALLLLAFTISVYAKCSSSYINNQSSTSCVQPCDGSGILYPLEFDNLNISPYPLSQSSETTVSLRIRSEHQVKGFGAEINIESAPFFFLAQDITINNVCEEYDLPAEQCTIPQTEWVDLLIPFELPSGPLLVPGNYCGKVTIFDLSGNLLTCLGFNIVITP